MTPEQEFVETVARQVAKRIMQNTLEKAEGDEEAERWANDLCQIVHETARAAAGTTLGILAEAIKNCGMPDPDVN